MTFRDSIALAICALALGGCANDLDWQPIGRAQSRFAWRSDSELWGYGREGVSIRRDGEWQAYDVCDTTSVQALAFSGDEVWLQCGTGIQRLTAAGELVEVRQPPETDAVLAHVADGSVAVVTSRALYEWNGADDWTEIAPAWTGGVGIHNECAGHSLTDLYCIAATALGGSPAVIIWFDGSAWTEVASITAYAPLQLRDGEVWFGAGRLTGGTYESWAGTTERPLVPVAIAPPSTVIWAGVGDPGPSLHVWRAERGSGALEFMGDGPITGGGPVDFAVYAIDRDTLLVTSTFASASATMLEGHL